MVSGRHGVHGGSNGSGVVIEETGVSVWGAVKVLSLCLRRDELSSIVFGSQGC